jgi:hypothetical protein
MFTLLKLGVSLVALLAFAWFGMTQKLGSRTLFEHMHAIGQTRESQELMDGTRQAAGPLVDDVRHRIGGKDDPDGKRPPPMARDAGAPQERLSSSEQRQLRYLLDKATH